MERRTAIRNLVIMAGGIAILPSCSPDKGKSSIQLNKLDISADQEAQLAEIVETIIPETKTPGAKKLGLHLFVLKMVDDCHDENDQQKFVAGLKEIDQQATKRFGDTFTKCTTEQRREIVKQMESKENISEVTARCYDIVKGRTMQGYFNSRYVMTELIPYELVPSRYNGFFPVKNA